MPERINAPKVAIIMPAYNAAAYIADSVRSVLAQSERDIELIVVNDGSKDETARILAGMAREDPRLRPMTVPNGGPAMARNWGIEAMQPGTSFVMFVDSDDMLAPDAVEYALQGAAQGAALTVFGFTIVGADGSKRDYCEPAQSIGPDEMEEAFPRLYKANLLNQVWGKLYKAELVTGPEAVRFRDYRWGEDRLFVFDCLERTGQICVLPACKYSYVMHKGESLITKYYDKKFQVCLESDRQAEALGERFGVKDQAVLRYMFAKSVFSCITTLFSPSCPLSHEEKLAAVREIVDNEQVKRRCRDAAGGLPVNALCAIVQSGSPALVLAAFRLVALAGQTAPRLFTAIKHRK